MNHIRLSGRNNDNITRTVYRVMNAGRYNEYDLEIGQVEPRNGLWIARDMQGREHGKWWLTDWYAADALTRVRL